nr:MAG TPA: DNA methyl phosphotriester repair domain protein [Caudoviricetes sp.]
MNGYFSHKVKNIWAVILALIASMLVLSGCGGTSDGASSAANSTAVVTVDATPVPTPEVTPEPLPEPTPVVTPEPTPVPTPIATLEPTTKTTKAPAKKEATVVVTRTGEKYHTASCRYVRGKNDTRTLTLSKAKAQGYSACKVCH